MPGAVTFANDAQPAACDGVWLGEMTNVMRTSGATRGWNRLAQCCVCGGAVCVGGVSPAYDTTGVAIVGRGRGGVQNLKRRCDLGYAMRASQQLAAAPPHHSAKPDLWWGSHAGGDWNTVDAPISSAA